MPRPGAPHPSLRFASAAARVPGTSLSLWRVSGPTVDLVAVQGPQPVFPASGSPAAFFPSMRPDGQLTVAGLVDGPHPSLAYALMPAGERGGLIVYVEVPLTRHVSVPPGGPFSGVDLAVYLGPVPADSQLVQATAPVPMRGERATTRVPFGDTSFLVLAASRTGLTGSLSAALTWIVLGVGGLLALASGTTVEMLSRRRVIAERLAAVNQRMYQQQRSIAGTLQHALLPELPQLEDVEAGARYVAGGDDLEVGGDWYDVIPGPSGRCVFVVGDISGQGLRAATTMAELRFAVRAYLVQGDDIGTVLTKLRGLLDIDTRPPVRDAPARRARPGRRPDQGRLRRALRPLVITGGRRRSSRARSRLRSACRPAATRSVTEVRSRAGDAAGVHRRGRGAPRGGPRHRAGTAALDSGTRRGAAAVSGPGRRAGDGDGRWPRRHGDPRPALDELIPPSRWDQPDGRLRARPTTDARVSTAAAPTRRSTVG